MMRSLAPRVGLVVLVGFGGCTVFDHANCVEYQSLFGPCSWTHSAVAMGGVFALAAVSTGLMMVVVTWMLLPLFRSKP